MAERHSGSVSEGGMWSYVSHDHTNWPFDVTSWMTGSNTLVLDGPPHDVRSAPLRTRSVNMTWSPLSSSRSSWKSAADPVVFNVCTSVPSKRRSSAWSGSVHAM